METTQLSLPVTINQLISLARQLSSEDKKRLLDVLNQDVDADELRTHWASEQVLAKEWLNDTEEKAWQHL
jgi:hypothetical protein